jgi:hypothetical protein
MPAVGHTPPIPPPTPPSCSECASKTQPACGRTSNPNCLAHVAFERRQDPHRHAPVQRHLRSHLEAHHRARSPEERGEHHPGDSAGVPIVPPGTKPGVAAAVHPPSVQMQDLGKSMIEGHEVEGKRYTLPHVPPPPKPSIPGMKLPSAPPVPGAKLPSAPSGPNPPGAPAPPKAPTLPPSPSVAEVWTSVQLNTPVLTKVTTAAGEHTTYCKPTLTAEHPPSVFQVPPGYKIKSKL